MTENWISDVGRDALWFSAKLRFELIRNNNLESRELEDRVYLFECESPESAPAAAIEVGKQHEYKYKTEAGEELEWRFLGVLKVMMTFLDTPLDRGIEIYAERIAPR